MKFDISTMIDDGVTSDSNKVVKVPICDLIEYRNHPFSTYEGERFNDMVDSIKKYGVIVPIIIRPIENGKYEILSGHNRRKAAATVGIMSIPAIIKKDISDDEAEMYVTETNALQRGFSEMKISEQARVLEMRYSSMFNKEKLVLIQAELDILEGNNSEAKLVKPTKLAETGEEYGLSQATVARMLRIAKLINSLQKRVDKGNIKIRTGVELSYLPEQVQEFISDELDVLKEEYVLPCSVAKEIRARFKECQYPESITKVDVINIILADVTSREKRRETANPVGVKIPRATYDKYFGKIKTKTDIPMYIEMALDEFFKNRQMP